MLDRFMIGRVGRISPEAPVPVVVFENEEVRLGGAANVAHNLRALGGAVDLIGVIGDDDSGTQLKNELAAKGIHSTGLITDPGRRTTTKLRVVTIAQSAGRRALISSRTMKSGTPSRRRSRGSWKCARAPRRSCWCRITRRA